MMVRSTLSGLWLLSQLCLAATGEHVLHEKRGSLPPSWSKVSRAPSSLKAPIRIALTPQNVDQGHDALMDISNPESDNFGQHWTAEQVYNTFSPDQKTVAAVQEWLTQSGVPKNRQHVSSSKSYISFRATMAEAEALFHTDYHVLEDNSGRRAVSCDEYSVPSHLTDAIDFITPGVGLHLSKLSPAARQQDQQAQDRSTLQIRNSLPEQQDTGDSDCCSSSFVTPACIRQKYGIPSDTKSQPGNDMGLYENQGPYNQELLNAFFTNLAPSIPNGTHPINEEIDGGNATAGIEEASGETILDLSIAYPLVHPQAIRILNTYPSYDREDSDGFLDDFLDAIDASYCTSPGSKNSVDPTFPNKYWNHSLDCGIYKPPNVISISYDFNFPPVPSPAYLMRQCHEYLKLGLQGVSILVASGDDGATPAEGGCLNASEPIRTYFPADCPYVLSVGATQLDGTSNNREVAAFNTTFEFYSSGGGFSSTFAQPSYQKAAVEHFFNISTELPPGKTFNRSNRAYPDVAALGQNIAVYSGPQYDPPAGEPVLPVLTTAGGTSAASPLMAALVNRINGLRLAAGKKTLGFLNPIFYGHPEMFNDITVGYNLGCSANFSSTDYAIAFHCVKGWDPVSGLGTPNYPKMVEYLTSLK